MITNRLHYAAVPATRLRHHGKCTQELLSAFLKGVNRNENSHCNRANPATARGVHINVENKLLLIVIATREKHAEKFRAQ